MAGQAVTPAAGAATNTDSTAKSVTDAFGLSFESLLKIVLTQLTYQDPLKPMDNYEFVSQLAQFSQIQQGQKTNDSLDTLVRAQATLQATSLLGRRVDIDAGSTTLTGKVKAITFRDGETKLTVETTQGLTINDLSLTSVVQIREGN
ncbi:flagellar hook capping protein [Sphingomonas colocasiae]|uniref:Basal-body rod modification protein FlgD n=2 Tax=Sphingomonas colocasiae TaxID=1848973 RepID=A0ABS7PW21_9SPHN|nr:flagellar hook capping protein [Sphingomonas colocasiae]